MDISITANYFWQKRNCTDRRTPDERIRICADAGFKFMDYSVNVWDDQWEAQTDAIMNAAAKYGLTIDQSHAPFNFYKKAPRDIFDRMLERSVESAIKMGVKALVFHADEYRPPEGTPFNSEEGVECVYDVLAPHIEKLTKGGVKAALETVFEDKTLKPIEGKRYHFCADLNELIAVIDKFNDPMVGCCWDSGHTKLNVGNDGHVDALRRLGSRINRTGTGTHRTKRRHIDDIAALALLQKYLHSLAHHIHRAINIDAKQIAKKLKPNTKVTLLINNSDPRSFLFVNKSELPPDII